MKGGTIIPVLLRGLRVVVFYTPFHSGMWQSDFCPTLSRFIKTLSTKVIMTFNGKTQPILFILESAAFDSVRTCELGLLTLAFHRIPSLPLLLNRHICIHASLPQLPSKLWNCFMSSWICIALFCLPSSSSSDFQNGNYFLQQTYSSFCILILLVTLSFQATI